MKASRRLPLAALLGLAITLTSNAAVAEDLLDQVKSSGVLRIGVQGTYVPFDYRNEKGELDGFDVAVAKILATRLGVKPEFITTEWSGIIAGLQAGKFDVIVNQVAITPKRQAALDFSEPYAYSAVQVIQRSDDKREFRSFEDLKGKQIGVVLGTNFAEMAKAVPGVGVQTYPGPPEKLRDVAAGRVDAALDDRLTLPYVLKKVDLPLRPGGVLANTKIEMGIPFRKGNPKFAKAINDALESMRRDGTLQKLSTQWFGIDTSRPAVP